LIAGVRAIMLAENARRNGILSLQGHLAELVDTPFFYKGIAMVVDGIPGDDVELLLQRDVQATLQRHDKAANVLRKAAEVSPAMGLIGTLIGLVQMLGNLDDPSTIGPSMAVALLTTFYGALLANMVFMPLAAKLERNSSEEALVNQIYMMGVASISRQRIPPAGDAAEQHPAAAQRVQYYD
jgi:Flagellar motor component